MDLLDNYVEVLFETACVDDGGCTLPPDRNSLREANEFWNCGSQCCTILEMADLPATQNKSSSELTKVQDVITDYLADGYKPGQIARKLAKGDEKEAKKWRRRIRNWSYSHPAFQQALAAKVQGELIMGTGEVTQAVLKRANRGRIDAAKLVYEASGFHNPKVQHEHSGDIKVTLDIPRPVGPGKPEEGQVVDAEVVEEE